MKCPYHCFCPVVSGQLPDERVSKCLGCMWLVRERQIGDDTWARMCRGEYLLGAEHGLSGKCLQSQSWLWGWGAGMGCKLLSLLHHLVNLFISVVYSPKWDEEELLLHRWLRRCSLRGGCGSGTETCYVIP